MKQRRHNAKIHGNKRDQIDANVPWLASQTDVLATDWVLVE
jgi:hypothetical protein|nr:MAG TPA: Protein of unknown function (DUF2829) [Caudoviricetes sp.]